MLSYSTFRVMSWSFSPGCSTGHRRRIGTPKGSRALGSFRQAVLVLRWFRERSCVHCLARDAGISQATGYCYLHEGVDVLAEQAPDMHRVLAECRKRGMNGPRVYLRHRRPPGPGRHADRVRPRRRYPHESRGQGGGHLVFGETQGVRSERAVPVRPERHPVTSWCVIVGEACLTCSWPVLRRWCSGQR
jgi:hypothetical protein